MTVYVSIIQDRHTDVEAELFTTAAAAVAYARAAILDIAHGEEDGFEEEDIEGWVYFAQYKYERDCVRV